MIERTLVLIKPDTFRYGCVAQVLARFLGSGFEIIAAKKIYADAKLIEAHYQKKFSESPEFRDEVIKYLTSGPITALVLQRGNVIAQARELIGPLGGGAKGTIRGDFPSDKLHSLVHGSDSPEAAEYEIMVWFPELDLGNSQPKEEKRMKSFSDLQTAERHFVEAIATKLNGHDLHAQASAQRCLSALVGRETAEDTASGHVVEFGKRKICLPDFLHITSALKRFHEIGINIY